jgi:CarD family transcriptional regulator
MMKFTKGETVVEPTIGICTVFGMKVMKVDGQDMVVYIFDAQNAKVYVPADQVEKRGIRRPMTRDDVKRVLASLKRPASPNRADARLQYTNYRDIMKSGDPVKITNLLRDLYILDQNDDLKGKEKEIMEQARKFLTDEIAFVRDQSKTQVGESINEALRGMYKKKIQKDKERAKKSGVGLIMGVLGYEDDEEYEDEEEDIEIVEKPKSKKKAVEEEVFEEDEATDEGATDIEEAVEEEEFEEDL